MKHRGTDPLAIAVANNLGLVFDGMQTGSALGYQEYYPRYPYVSDWHFLNFYQFTIAPGKKGKGITFCVRELSQAKTRLKEKLKEFGLKE